MADFRQEFIAFSIECGVLRFGEFVTRSGRNTPYFFNAGLFNTGARLGRLAGFYAKAILDSGLAFDMLFGPAYKGIVLASAVSVALANAGCDVPFAYNRKEAKDHGEGGSVVGAPLAGRVLIIDDVITAGTAVRESLDIIGAAGASAAGVAVSLDRMERGQGELSAIQEVRERYGLPVVAIATLEDLLAHLQDRSDLRQNIHAIQQYRELYGAPHHA
ncbi:MAG: orotate phosphoribosyltransferase [Betaproteobacteria bacterium RIFCSPLOWO2_02_FULL_65_24]|nr:MAG: orotate phosphoribosyltransferase [Betaproteobacteria bacterium RIFCSPLOWO2_02_FULL_65_24]OGA77644.1 MAG: orotate phosphoribosyltransferase [Betaproteobacteria bacterium RIFCSPLOWO2_12_FULL_66_14]